ncbi:MAG: phosphoribosylglycinamide formyltransferase [Patescibacteria group bacterium]|nr:phosphoribosylglycinamide formyltransferase [Patescibacteria group bacterium]
MTERKRIGIMISGSGTNMQAIVRACEIGHVDADVVFVESDSPDASGLVWARERQIPTFVEDYKERKLLVKHRRVDNTWMPDDDLTLHVYEKSTFVCDWFNGNRSKQLEYIRQKIASEYYILAKAREYRIDLLVLAGFMQVCTSFLIDAMSGGDNDPRIMNIHPALLPSFPGVDGYGDTIRYGCKVGGCTVHFVDYGEDTGPIIGQRAIPVLPDDDVDSFRKRGLQEEYKLFPECIQLFVQNRLKLETVKQSDDLMRKIVKIS